MVVWLEDQKIRRYKIDERGPLRNTKLDEDWNKIFLKYLADLACPFQNSPRPELIDWLLSLAVQLEFNENSELYSGKDVAKEPSVAIISNPLDNLDCELFIFNKEYRKIMINQINCFNMQLKVVISNLEWINWLTCFTSKSIPITSQPLKQSAFLSRRSSGMMYWRLNPTRNFKGSMLTSTASTLEWISKTPTSVKLLTFFATCSSLTWEAFRPKSMNVWW